MSELIHTGHLPDKLPLSVRLHNLTVPIRNWWLGAFGRRAAFIEGRDIAIDHAAMIAHDMGRPDICEAINNSVKAGERPTRLSTPGPLTTD